MRMLVLLALALSITLAFAFGGGGGGGGSGGGGSSSIQPVLSHSFACASGILTVSATTNSQPISGMELRLSDRSVAGFTAATTDSSGTATFTITHRADYRVSTAPTSAYAVAEIERMALVPCPPQAENVSPNTTQQEQRMPAFALRDRALPCGDEATLRERVRCRLSVRTDDYSRLYYVPEECRAMNDSRNRTACLELYDSVQSCRKLEGDASRFACVRQKLGISGTVRQAVAACKASSQPRDCLGPLSERVYSLAKFKLYNLEESAEYLVEEGLPREKAEAFVAQMEQLKLDFNAAGTVQQKQEILRIALSQWQSFKADAIASLSEDGNS